MLHFTPDGFKDHKMCDKAVNNYSYALRFVPDCYKSISTYPSAIQFVPEYL